MDNKNILFLGNSDRENKGCFGFLKISNDNWGLPQIKSILSQS